MKRKNIISLTIAFAFFTLAISGLLLYFKQKAHIVEIGHTIFGLLFVGFAIFHVINNWQSLKNYSKDRTSGKFQKELLVASIIFGVLLIGVGTNILEPVAEAGRVFAKKREQVKKIAFEEIETNKSLKGTPISILIEKNKVAKMPIIAIWLEDSTHTFVEPIFVPAKILVEKQGEEEPEIKDFSSSLLPTLMAKNPTIKSNYDKATPKDNFILKTQITQQQKCFIVMEIASETKTERYQTPLNNVENNVFKLKSETNTLINKALVIF